MYSNQGSNFPSQVVSDLEKDSLEYGLKVAKSIESEWFSDRKRNRYHNIRNKFHNLRLYARGEQSVQKYKDELSINGDLSYLNLDWTPVPIIPKFVDIVVNGMSQRSFEVKAQTQDEYGVSKRTKYMKDVIKDMRARNFKDKVKSNFNMDFFKTKRETLPNTEEEFNLHMQLDYKQAVEIAEEQAINTLLQGSQYDLIRTRVLRDITVLGIGAVKTNFNYSEGAVVEYVDPANLVYSKTSSPYFDDIYYVGEVKLIPINELVREFPELTQEELKQIEQNYSGQRMNYGYTNEYSNDRNMVQLLYFNYKTFTNDTYKLKTTSSGADKAIEKPDTFNPPEEKQTDFIRLTRQVECLYEGVLVLGTKKLLKWKKSENMMRSKSDFNRVKMNYSIVAPRMYNDRIESLVSRITGFADMIQLTHLKLQQVLAKMVPDGVYLDADGLAEVDLGNGTNYNPQEALNMFFQTGSVIGRSFTADGDQNPGKVPIQQISNAAGGNKMQSLISTYNYYLQMIRDVTGLNEARDGSVPDARALVGVQKLAAANSNTATRHILNSMLFLTADACEKLSLRISDILEYSPTKEAFISAIGAHNVATLNEVKDLYLYDFGIFITLEPDEEEKQKLENNIQMALQSKLIDLDDAIDLRDVKNVKVANQLLKIKRKKKAERDQQMQQQNIQAQSQANTQSQQAAAQTEVQKRQQLIDADIKLESSRNALKIEYLNQEAALKRQLMDHEFQLNLQLRKMEADEKVKLENVKQKQKPTKPFESSGNDAIGSGAGIDIGGLAGQ